MEDSLKKVLLLVVEGPTDKTTFEAPLNDLLISKGLDEKFFCAVYHTDFTTHKFGNPEEFMTDDDDVIENVKECVTNFLKSRENTNKFGLKDIVFVATLSDLDCCYCKADDVEVVPFNPTDEKKTRVDFVNKKFLCNDKPFILRRNIIKQNSLGILSSEGNIVIKKHKMKFRAYYCSINLEHALYGNTNQLSEQEKEDMASEFRQNVREDLSLFEKQIDSIPIISNDYKESWNEIQLMAKPFERMSNIKLLIDILLSLCTELFSAKKPASKKEKRE